MTTNLFASFLERRPILSIIIFLCLLLWISTLMPPGEKPDNPEHLNLEWLSAVEETMLSGGEIDITVCESYVGCGETYQELYKFLSKELKMKAQITEIPLSKDSNGYVYAYWKYSGAHMYFIFTIEPDGLQSARLYTSLIPLKY